jgi:predicted DNA-binding transcriptional regulator AlpA
MSVEALWSKYELASWLGVSVSWVAHNRHLLPEPCRIGHQLRWIPAEVRSWAAARREEPDRPPERLNR